MDNNKTIRKISKHIAMMKIAENISKLSYDPKYKVGSILVKNDYTDINAIGYNGNYAGGPNERINLNDGESGFIHAEANLLIHSTLNRDTVKDYTVFITLKPCMNCAKMLINKGVKRIIYLNNYAISDSETLLRSVGIEIMSLEEFFYSEIGDIDISEFVDISDDIIDTVDNENFFNILWEMW